MKQYNLFDDSFVEYQQPKSKTKSEVQISSREELICHIARELFQDWTTNNAGDFDEWFDEATKSLCKKDSNTYKSILDELGNYGLLYGCIQSESNFSE